MHSVNSKQGVISVIIPVHNVKPYLAEAIESVINQTFSSFEIILVETVSHASVSEKIAYGRTN